MLHGLATGGSDFSGVYFVLPSISDRIPQSDVSKWSFARSNMKSLVLRSTLRVEKKGIERGKFDHPGNPVHFYSCSIRDMRTLRCQFLEAESRAASVLRVW